MESGFWMRQAFDALGCPHSVVNVDVLTPRFPGDTAVAGVERDWAEIEVDTATGLPDLRCRRGIVIEKVTELFAAQPHAGEAP